MFGDRSGGLNALLERKRPSSWSLFISAPTLFLSRVIYSWRRTSTGSKFSTPKRPILKPIAIREPKPLITVVCISDTHNSQVHVPNGDILLHAGDLTQSGSRRELQDSINWLNRLPHKHKVIIAGNHDIVLDHEFPKSKELPELSTSIDWGDIIYLQNSSVTLACAGDQKLKIYGSPWSRRHGNWAFQYPPSQDVWHGTIPSDVDILMTHTPPKGHLDLNFGCGFLLDELWRLERKPRLHVFGHVHEGYGQDIVVFDKLQKAYENISRGSGGLPKLLKVFYEYLRVTFRSHPPPTSMPTIMVNAAQVGGLRDEIVREPVIVNL